MPVVCLQSAVPEWIADTDNVFGSLSLCVAHHDEEFVELLASGHWLEELLKFLLLYLYNSIHILLLIWIYHWQQLHILPTVIVATASALLSISNQFSNSSFDMPSGAWSIISLVRSDSSEESNCRTTHLSLPLSLCLDRELNYRWHLNFRNG